MQISLAPKVHRLCAIVTLLSERAATAAAALAVPHRAAAQTQKCADTSAVSKILRFKILYLLMKSEEADHLSADATGCILCNAGVFYSTNGDYS
jgi:hypothetical protein